MHGRPGGLSGRRRALSCALAAAAVLAAGASAAASTRPRPRVRDRAASAPATLRVTQVEYRLGLSHATVRAGRVSLEAIDRGHDPHDLRLRPLGSSRQIVAPQLGPGQRWAGVVRLAPGTYTLWCSLPEHARLGMRATLRVVG